MIELTDVKCVSQEKLEKLAALAPKEDSVPAHGRPRKEKTRKNAPGLGPVDVEKYLDHYGFQFTIKKEANKTIYRLSQCLFDPTHKRNEASIIQDVSGLITYQCFHQTCSHTWDEARRAISGDDSLAPFCEGYDPNWTPPESAYQPLDEDRPFLKVSTRGRVQFNAAEMADYLKQKFEPVVNEGKDFGGLFYRYNQERGLWEILPEAALRAAACEELGSYAQTRRISDTITLLQDKTYVPPQRLVPNPYWINLKNCMLNIETLERKAHSAEFNSRVQLPVEYDPEALCSRWIEALAEIFADDTRKANVLQELFGYCLYPKILFPCAVFQIGGGSNGKGTVQKVLEAMLGDENVSHISLQRMEEKFGPVELKDKLLNACGETAQTPLEVTRFKEICAGDKVQAEVKYKPDVVFQPIAKHLISMNEFPGIKDKTDAFFRRVIVLEYTQKFEGDSVDLHLAETLIKTELNGIFRWALEGLKRVLEKKVIQAPESVQQAKHRFRAKVNPVLMFVEEECVLEESVSVLPKELFEAYNEWCEEAKIRSLGKQRFYEQIYLNFKVRKQRANTKERFFGIGLLNKTNGTMFGLLFFLLLPCAAPLFSHTVNLVDAVTCFSSWFFHVL